MRFVSWIGRFLSSDNDYSSKRLICVVLVAVYIVALFLLMYLHIELPNKDLVKDVLDGIYWLILIFGGFIAAEPVLNKLKIGGAKTVNVENVENQDVKTDSVTVQKTKDSNL